MADDLALLKGPIAQFDVACLLVDPDGRYLMQLRDDFPHLPLRNHWGLFGGAVEAGETQREAMVRELAEELDFLPRELTLFNDLLYHFPGRAIHHKTFFVAPIRAEDVTAMTLREGAAMELLRVEALLQRPRIVPWDALGVVLHARRAQLLSPGT